VQHGVGFVGDEGECSRLVGARGDGELEVGLSGDVLGLAGAQQNLDVAFAGFAERFLQPRGDMPQVGGAEHEALLRVLRRFGYVPAQQPRVGRLLIPRVGGELRDLLGWRAVATEVGFGEEVRDVLGVVLARPVGEGRPRRIG
jgi:hypothetical protein